MFASNKHWPCATAAYFFLSLFAVPAPAETASRAFCAEAQQVLASTSLQATVVHHSDYEEFVASKALATPLTVQQFLSNPIAAGQEPARTLSCKMKTAERINAAAQSADSDTPVAGGDSSCHAVQRHWLQQLRAAIPPGQGKLSVEDWVVDEEELTFMGPLWLKPWPFQPLYRDPDGRLHVRTKALYVPFSWWIPMPDRFKGTYYCHFASPLYLEGLVRGTIAADL